MELNSAGDFGEPKKLYMEMVDAICRSCLSTDELMHDVYQYSEEILGLTGIHISPADGLPGRLCAPCRALLRRAASFRRQYLRAHNLLARCAPLPPSGPERRALSAAPLRRAPTLAFDNCKSRSGFAAVLQHERARSPPAAPSPPPELVVKSEGCSDYEDDIPLDEYKSSLDKRPPPAPAPAPKGGRRNKKRRRPQDEPEEGAAGPTRRRAADDVDPTKIRIITLNPEEQLKQMEEESRLDGAGLPFKCGLCFKGFNFENKLANHMRRHSPSRGPHACRLCRTHLPTAYSHRVHMRVHTRRYECLKCGRRMVDRGSILEHYRSQHEGIVSQYTCHLCGKLSSNSKTHRGHLRNHHGGERPACPRCGKTFVNKDSLAEHLLIHEGVKNYGCGQCAQRFRTKNQAKHHQLKHSDVRDHYCVECDVRFKSAHNLRQHLQKSLKHKDPKTFKFECPECGKRFESPAARERHLRVQHRGERAHACGQCGAALASRASLRKHARAHAAPRAPPQHVCHACGRAFRGKSVLLNHVRTHTGEKPFSCATCGRRFAQRTACRTHVRLVHLKLRRAKIKPESVTVGAPPEDVKPALGLLPADPADPAEPAEDKMAADLASYDLPVYF